VYYDRKEKPEEVWTELADGSCRWRQTGSEIKVICLNVPEEVAPRELDVSLQPFSIRVAHKRTKKVCCSIALKAHASSIQAWRPIAQGHRAYTWESAATSRGPAQSLWNPSRAQLHKWH
jgi:hypothetical protein